MTYVFVIPDDCTCKWVNHSDYSGWEMKQRDPACIHHGYGNPDGQP